MEAKAVGTSMVKKAKRENWMNGQITFSDKQEEAIRHHQEDIREHQLRHEWQSSAARDRMWLSRCIPDGRRPLGMPAIIFDTSKPGRLHRRKAEDITSPELLGETCLATAGACGSGWPGKTGNAVL